MTFLFPSNIYIFQQNCHNEPGSYRCSCQPGYTLNTADNQTCQLQQEQQQQAGHLIQHYQQQLLQQHQTDRQPQECLVSCHTAKRMKTTISQLEERVRALATALRLYSFSAGAPGPEGPPGGPGPIGPRGFPGMSSGWGILEYSWHFLQYT